MAWRLTDLEGGTCVLTINNRLAVELRGRYDRAQAQAGRVVWPSADILPWHAWLKRLYQQLLDTAFTDLDLISPAQERLLWQEIAQRPERRDPLLRPAAAAQCAHEAFALYHAWQLERYPLDTLGGDETRTFLHWARAFTAESTARGLLSTAQLLPLIGSAFEQGLLPPPAHLVYSGFDALSPAHHTFFDLLRNRGCAVDEHQPTGRRGDCRRIAAADAETEMRTAAEWARRQLHQDPAARIGIVVPQITQRRRDLQRVFTEVLAAPCYLPNGGRQAVFNVSLGEPLGERPLIAHALDALDLLTGEQPLNTIGQLLRSPFVGGHAAEWEARALFDAALRQDGLPLVGLQRLRTRLGHCVMEDPRHCPDLAARLERLAQRRRQLPRRDTPAGWAVVFHAVMQTLGWPGDHPLDSDEYQQRERLQRLFSELAELGKVRPQMRLGEALAQLRSLASETLFQPESPPAPVQILGPLEAAGMDFDALWLLGMDDRAWPPAPSPNPLLPVQLQRELGMPHASAARELAFASALTERLLRSAPTLIASHACSEGEREQRPSPLISAWPPAREPRLQGGLRGACAQTGGLEPLPVAEAGPARAEQRGGAGLLSAQANCPFQAVARFRLAARPLEEASFAADGALLGTMVHELLQRVWQRLGDSAGLARHDATALQALVTPLAAATLDDLGRRRPDLLTPRFRAIEAQRLTRLVIDWLDVERTRGQAFTVTALEQDQEVELHGLRLSTRADRVDRLADGSLAIIDYKTGRLVSSDGWYDARLTEPQLPLYCRDREGEVSAVLLARVRRDQPGCVFIGLSRDSGFAPGVVTPQETADQADWTQTLAHWRQALDGLADEFVAGRADPTPSPQACTYCPYGALCRVREMLTEDDDA